MPHSQNNIAPNSNVTREHILTCAIQDAQGLNDFQKLPDLDGIAIPQVGINRFRTPILLQHSHGVMNHDAVASMSVNLAPHKTGINMSRLCQILQQETESAIIDIKNLKNIVHRFRDELRDHESEPLLKSATIHFSFLYPMKQPSLKSGLWGWQYYPCEIRASQIEDGTMKFQLALRYEYSSTCPCSLSMAKQYEQDFISGVTTEGNGIGVAHGQRSQATISVLLDEHLVTDGFYIEELVVILRAAIPTETQSMVKRIDEQAFAIVNGSNPMFVEHACKRLHAALNRVPEIVDWMVELEHLESLHSHNAAASICKGIPGGFNTFHQRSIFSSP